MVINMNFENVDISSLRNALIQCKNAIDHSATDELINNISNPSVWQASSQINLKKALTKLINERYKNLENKINSYLNIVSSIEEYQNLQKENLSLENQYSSLSNKLYDESTSERVKDASVESQMSNVQRRINDNKEKMENLKNKVSNSI